ncbi:Small heat shock protein HSP16.5 [Candidatus Norongarragalina meridionalis]|nr:Small heat shock protein HSP16.5 [Candidatus Norongarragalina meridionalis]
MKRSRRQPFDDDFFPGFGDIDEIFEKMLADMERMQKTGGTPQPGKPMVYGFSMRVGQDGKPQVSQFGNVERGKVKDEREPLVDVLNGEKEITVIVELPGVAKEHLKLITTENALDVEVTDPQQRFAKRISLPARVLKESAKAKLKNGILEVILKKKNPEKGAKTISVE